MKIHLPKKINRIILILIVSDVLIISAWGLISPFLTIFMTEQISDGTIQAAGFATTIFLIVSGILQIPISIHLDKKEGYMDEYFFIVAGSLLSAISCLLFILSTQMIHIYLIQIIYALGCSFAYPAWYSLFSRNVDEENTAFEWTIYNTAIALGTAVSASIGGLMISGLGYQTTFTCVAAVSVIGSILLMSLKKYLKD